MWSARAPHTYFSNCVRWWFKVVVVVSYAEEPTNVADSDSFETDYGYSTSKY